MKISILGATGRTGRLLVEQALAEQHKLKVLVRDVARLSARPGPALQVVVGDACVAADVERTIAGTQIVLMALGHTPTSTADVLARAAGHVVRYARKHGVRRIIALTTGSIIVPADRPARVHRVLVSLAELMFHRRFADARRQAKTIERSGLEYVLVRATRLCDEPGGGVVRAGYLDGPISSSVPRADVARFMLQQLSNDAFVGQVPIVSRRTA